MRYLALFCLFAFGLPAMGSTLIFKVQIDDDMKTEVLESFVKQHGYQTTVGGKPNPESVDEAATRILAAFIKESFAAYSVNNVVQQARAAAVEDADAVIIKEEAKAP